MDPSVFARVPDTATPSQRAAIEAEPRSLLLVAGPGSGKTFCLIERIRHLIQVRGVPAERIHAFTFTNKAAGEIAARLDQLPEAQRVTRTTLHRFCVRFLRAHGEAVGVDPGFGIADDAYQGALLTELGCSRRHQNALLQRFALHRLRGDVLGPSDARWFDRYSALLRKRRVLDFDLLLLRAAQALEGPAGDEARAQSACVLVDEFQDLNPVQYRVVHALARDHRHVFAVGDYDQSIYGWAAAEPRLFQRFMHDFGVAGPLYLRENHRTARNIFALARSFVEGNPMLPGFDGRPVLAATRAPSHPVIAREFETPEDEAAWLVEDLRAQREAEPGLCWGDCALLYRTHELGNLLEAVLLRERIPCRLAQGRAVGEDPIVAYVVAALGVMLHPRDAALQERFLRVVLPRTLVERARAEAERRCCSLLVPLRELRDGEGQHQDEIRRAISLLKNLGDYLRRHGDLGALLEELLSRRVGPYRNPLAERHPEITDPAEEPEVVGLAARLRELLAQDAELVLPPLGGAEIPCKAILHRLGFRVVHVTPGPHPGAADVFAAASAGPPARSLFKAAQLLTAARFQNTFADYTAVDIETTGLEVQRCEIVEIAAVRVRGGRPVAEFHRLVKPARPIPAAAADVHGIDDAAVADAASFAEVWPAFRAFCGDDVLVAHNGANFDFPVIQRLARGMPGADGLATYDSLPLAFEITPTSRKLENLARDYGIDPGRSHGALDDARTLALVFDRLNRDKVARSRKSCLLQMLDHLGVALALSGPLPETGDARTLADLARPFALGAYGEALDYYRAQREQLDAATLPSADEVVDRLGGVELMERIRARKSADERYPSSMQRLRLLMEGSESLPLPEQIDRLLEQIALSSREPGDTQAGRVNLLTLHATKGLEFSRVYLVGAEDDSFCREKDGREQVEESRRLFYVGMTRARDRLVFTRSLTRGARTTGGARFLHELGIQPEPAPAAEPAPAELAAV